MAESTTMASMNQTAGEPTALGEALAPIAAKLRAMGLDPDAGGAEPTALTETPAEARARHQIRMDGLAARWRDRAPAMFRDASVDALDERQYPVRVQSWLHSGSLHLVLAGPVGTGKTYAAYAVGNQALAAGKWVEAYAVGDLMDALRPGSSDSSADHRARSCQVLILDDLTGKATDWEAERMTLLLDARVREQRQTIVTTNISSAQIETTWGGRFLDRLTHRMTALTFTGDSRRKADW
jgi:DNA replication protein DnaC